MNARAQARAEDRAADPWGPAWMAALAGVALLAATLRFVALGQVPPNTFYDAAVRSMAGSWHNLLYGAFDPSAAASIDKPPIDLWLQVASVKLFGFQSAALKYPSALAGTLAVALLYDLVRRFAGRPAALASAFSLAILPISVLTSRSDTMDSLMMGLLVLSAWLVVLGAQRGQLRWLLLAALVGGVAFNVKLFEALVAAPALLVLAVLGHASGAGWRPRVLALAAAGAVFGATALSWMTLVSLTPGGPYPIGSTDGSVWNAVFVYNGIDRVTKTPHPDRFSASGASARGLLLAAAPGPSAAPSRDPHPPLATPMHRRARVGAGQAPAGPRRLFDQSGQDYGGALGVQLLAALVFGGLALALGWSALRAPPRRLQRAGAGALAVWLLTGLVLFSLIGRLHPRYLEAFTPAVAAGIGVGVMSLASRAASAAAMVALAGALAVVSLDGVRITGAGKIVGDGRDAAIVLSALALAVIAAAVLVRRRRGDWPPWGLPPLIGALAVLGFAPFALARDVRLIGHHNGDQALSPSIPTPLLASLSRYLRANQGSARYEVAASAPSLVAPLIVRDARPVVLLTTVDARPLVSLDRLRTLAGAGQVRYVMTRGSCPVPRNHKLPACSAAVAWVSAHATDVSAQVAPGQSRLLYRIG